MGNYRDLDTEFIERTLLLISQYESQMHKYEFEEQFNHTLLINCLLGLIVFPKERIMSYLPTDRITTQMLTEMGLIDSSINRDIKRLKDLIIQLRHAVAHFEIEFISDNEDFLIDKIEFKNEDGVVASFVPRELLSFIRYYSSWLLSNIQRYE